jgi:hypothetical protein
MVVKNKKLKYIGRFVGFVFLFDVFINLVKYENNLYATTTYHHYRNQTEVELILSDRPEDNLNFVRLNIFPKQVRDFTFAHIDFSSIHKYWLIHYQNCLLVQLKSLNRTFILNQQLTSNLQNLWYHSSFELGNLVVRQLGNKAIK